MKLTREEWGLMALALESKVRELSQLPEPLASSTAAPFVEVHTKIAKMLESEAEVKK